jgi:broad-specificity NMP kinase
LNLNNKENLIIESHFAHFINPKFVDLCFVINRGLNDLKNEYEKRKYIQEKKNDNLEVESFNLCFYEAIENGYKQEQQVFCIKNENIKTVIEKIINKIEINNN